MVIAVVGHVFSFATTGVFIPLIIALGVEATLAKDISLATTYGLGVLLAAVVGSLFMAVAVWAFNANGVLGAEYVYRRVFANYLSKDYEFFSNNYVGALGTNVTMLRKAFLDYQLTLLFNLPRIFTTAFASLAVVLWQAPLLALIIAISMAANFGYIYIFARYRLKYRAAVSDAAGKVAGIVGDSLSHGSTVKSFASESYEKARLEAGVRSWAKAQLKSWSYFTPMSVGRNMISFITIAILIIVSAHLYAEGKISVAIVALVQIYVVRLMNVMLEFGELIKAYDQTISDAFTPVQTMLTPVNVLDSQRPQQVAAPINILSFNAVTYHYPDAKRSSTAVKELSITIKRGERIGIVGYSGSGKTTLTKLLLRFMDVSDGAIEINGVDIRDVKQADLRSLISYVPQEPLLFHRSIAENISYAVESADNAAVQKAAKLAYVDEFVDDLPDGYETLVGERGVKLSGGQRQRVAIARALLKDAPILVLDEATSALDSRSEQLIQKALWRLMKGRTAIVIAHRLSTIQRLDHIIVMDKGQIVQSGTHHELLQDKGGIYAELWAHQSGGYIGDNTATE